MSGFPLFNVAHEVLHAHLLELRRRVQRRVLLDLAAAERPQPGDEVAGESAAPDDEPEDMALGLDDAMAGDKRGRGDDHRAGSSWWWAWAAARSVAQMPQGQRSRSSVNV